MFPASLLATLQRVGAYPFTLVVSLSQVLGSICAACATAGFALMADGLQPLVQRVGLAAGTASAEAGGEAVLLTAVEVAAYMAFWQPRVPGK